MGIYLSPKNAHDALALVGKLHRGILCDVEWEAALQSLAAYVGADFAASAMWDRRRDDLTIQDGGLLQSDAGARYRSHFQHIDPARERLQDMPVGAIYVDQLDFGPPSMSKSSFYVDFLHHYGIESVMAMVVERSEDTEWVIGFQRVRGRPLFDLENAIALRGILSHLQTAFKLRQKVRELQYEQAWSRITIDKIAFPIMLVDAHFAVLACNQSGERWLQSAHSPMNRIAHDPLLQKAVAQACGHPSEPPRVATLTMPLAGTDRHGVLVALPLPSTEDFSNTGRKPCALLIGIGLNDHAAPSDTLLRDLFALTRSEIALAIRLASGMTLNEASTTAGVGRETVRTHLKSVLRKTGTRRQSELTALLTGLSVVANE